jgi:hypothetical protein
MSKEGANSVSVVIIKKNGSYEEKQLTELNCGVLCQLQLKSIYKLCNPRSKTDNMPDSFGEIHKFSRKSFPKNMRSKCGLDYSSAMYDAVFVVGNNEGKAGQENKFEFPPPIDNDIFFGDLCLLKGENLGHGGRLVDLTIKEWKRMYEMLFGGFDDCGSNDGDSEDENEDEDENDIYVEMPTTKEGYAKDGFVVDDEDGEDGDEDEDYEDEEDEEFYLSDEEY